MKPLLLLLFLTSNALACTMTLQWKPPTTREDGSPLVASEIDRYELRCVGLDVTGSISGFIRGTARGYRLVSSRLPAGKYSCVAITHDINGVKSSASNIAIGNCI